ncbi:MAG TPA: acetyl-CoA C-acyltransferase [Polyangia bacterium]|jgi:acetyl-CoA C-acetyltransferase|nr:acetyl-CoA C-acyltransferase [Polyangia bacterium]
MRDVVIIGAARTPIGSFQGDLASFSAPKLGAAAIKAALQRAAVSADAVGEVYMGCVLAAGLGQAPARQASIAAGLPPSVGAVTVNKMCGSGLEAVVLGRNAIAVGEHDTVVAGGMESMTNAPYLLPKAREGLRLGHAQVIDSVIQDGLWDAYGNVHMGDCAELCAREKSITRKDQDDFAAESYRRALRAQADGKFRAEIVPVEVASRKGPPRVISDDEEPKRGDIEKLPSLRPAFQKEGTVTAGNASSINDGAAALVLAAADVAAARGWKPIARIVGSAGHAQAPEWFTTAPAGAIETLLKKVGWKAADVDLWEINEAFAVVSLINNKMLGLDPSRVNVWGGAVALGHPIGASGARVLVTLLSALRERGKRRGVASLCIGGGEGIAMAVEMST